MHELTAAEIEAYVRSTGGAMKQYEYEVITKRHGQRWEESVQVAKYIRDRIALRANAAEVELLRAQVAERDRTIERLRRPVSDEEERLWARELNEQTQTWSFSKGSIYQLIQARAKDAAISSARSLRGEHGYFRLPPRRQSSVRYA